MDRPPTSSMDAASDRVGTWFAGRGWTPFQFQRDTWRAYLDGRSGLVHAPTGTGKTLAVWLGPVMEELASGLWTGAAHGEAVKRTAAAPLRVLWITPMRALASDTLESLTLPVRELGLRWTLEKRTGDTSGSLKARQRERLPSALVTTPESLSLLLSYPGSRDAFSTLRCVIVDEWHELMSTKRGTQTELCLARLRAWNPGVRTWGLSATLGNLQGALETLVGRPAAVERAAMVSGVVDKEIAVRTLLPPSLERFPWAGHLGLRLLPQVLEAVESARTSLLFTNTRSQAELWFRAIVEAGPEWIDSVAIHHGSLDRELRAQVEDMLRAGHLRCVVCTSSLDLGVDFSPVDQVLQVGSPKGVARLLQRAGRSGHRPGAVSEVVCVPTNALELVEFAAARDAAAGRRVEARVALRKPLDVLVQHLVTVALGGGFEPGAMLEEVRGAWAYRDLSSEEWEWCLDFVTRGGAALGAYPQYARVVDDGGTLRVASRAVERMHRLGIGTISSDASVKVAYVGGATLGTIEEGFIAKLRPGDKFVFAGRALELVRVREMTAQVRQARSLRGAVPRWDGGKSPLSTQLAHAVRSKLSEPLAECRDPEMHAVAPLLDIQRRWSRIPGPAELLIEMTESRDGHHAFLYPFEGRLVHEGLGALLGHRLAARAPRSVHVSANDWGIELLSPELLPGEEEHWRTLLSAENLLDDLLACLNSTELTRRQFRDIARVAGLLLPNFPGAGRQKTARQLQASSELFFDVFTEFDPGNRLLEQARREVLEQQLEVGRLREALGRVEGQTLALVRTERLTPLAFPLWAEQLRSQQISSESWSQRVQKMVVLLEREADAPARKASARRSRKP
ncbi:MAG: ligase-associated DNA damage response DEXH box helicase [Planctomycetota bacterium]|nr:ligase-associated DNA damage response DEXH box helicase [Planctomycetota bacterium]